MMIYIYRIETCNCTTVQHMLCLDWLWILLYVQFANIRS